MRTVALKFVEGKLYKLTRHVYFHDIALMQVLLEEGAIVLFVERKAHVDAEKMDSSLQPFARNHWDYLFLDKDGEVTTMCDHGQIVTLFEGPL